MRIAIAQWWRTCAPLAPAARVRTPLPERLAEIAFSPFSFGDCASCRGSHGHVDGGAVSLTLSGTKELIALYALWWDVKELQRTRSSLSVTTLSVPIGLSLRPQ